MYCRFCRQAKMYNAGWIYFCTLVSQHWFGLYHMLNPCPFFAQKKALKKLTRGRRLGSGPRINSLPQHNPWKKFQCLRLLRQQVCSMHLPLLFCPPNRLQQSPHLRQWYNQHPQRHHQKMHSCHFPHQARYPLRQYQKH